MDFSTLLVGLNKEQAELLEHSGVPKLITNILILLPKGILLVVRLVVLFILWMMFNCAVGFYGDMLKIGSNIKGIIYICFLFFMMAMAFVRWEWKWALIHFCVMLLQLPTHIITDARIDFWEVIWIILQMLPFGYFLLDGYLNTVMNDASDDGG